MFILAVLVLFLALSCATMATTLNGRRIEFARPGKSGEWIYELQKNRALKYFKSNDKVLNYCDDSHLVFSGTHYFNDVVFGGGFENGTLVVETAMVCKDDSCILYIDIEDAYSLVDNSYRVSVPQTYISDKMVDTLLHPFMESFGLIEVPPRGSDATIDMFQIVSKTGE